MSKSTPPYYLVLCLMFFLFLAVGVGNDQVHQSKPSTHKTSVNASTSGDIYSGSGNWTITQATVYTDEVLTVYGNISIVWPGSLILDNTTIDFAPPNAVSTFHATGSTFLYIVNSHLYSSAKTFEISYENMAAGNISNSLIEDFESIGIGGSGSGGLYYTTIYGNVFRNCTGDVAAINAYFARAGTVNITNNEFYGWDATDTTGPENVIRVSQGEGGSDTIVHNNTIHDCSVGRNAFRTSYIWISPNAHRTIVTNNTLYNLGDTSSRASAGILINGIDTLVDGNVIRDSWAFGIDVFHQNNTVSNNRFSNLNGTYADLLGADNVPVILVRTFNNFWKPTNLTIVSNMFENNVGPAVWCKGTYTHNITIQNNIMGNSMGTSLEAAILLSDEAHNITIIGNLLIGNAVGVSIASNAMNQTIYDNAFLWNTIQALDYNHTNNIWNNVTHGNLWTNYDGTDAGNDWFGDSAFNVDGNITDNHPVYKIGSLPGAGSWTIRKPHAFWNHTVTVPADIILDASAAALVTIELDLKLTKGSAIDLASVGNTLVFFNGCNITVSSNGLDINTLGHLLVHDNEFSSGQITIEANDKSVEIQRNDIKGGLELYHAPGTIFSHNNVSGTHLYLWYCNDVQFLDGILETMTWVHYSDNTHFNSTDLMSNQLQIQYSHNTIIAHNNFSGFSREFSYSDGQIRIFRSDYCTVYDNNFLNSNDSIDVRFSDFTVIEKNYIELVDGYGIYLEGTSYNLTVRDNVFNGGTYGLTESLSENNHNMTIINNVFANMTGNAIYTRYSSNLIISFNTIYNVSGHGVYTDHGSNHRIHGNTIWNVSATGITTYGNNISLAHNIIYDCGTEGVYLSGVSYYAVVYNNTITHCGSDGLYSSDGGYYQAKIFNNTIAFNGGWGYYARYLTDSLLYTNYFYGNGDGSLYIRWGSNNQLDNGSVGNFYEEYRGVESGIPWIGATPWYARDINTDIVGTDNHPIMGMGDLTPATGDWIVDELTIIL